MRDSQERAQMLVDVKFQVKASPVRELGLLTLLNMKYLLRENKKAYVESINKKLDERKFEIPWFSYESNENKRKLLQIKQFCFVQKSKENANPDKLPDLEKKIQALQKTIKLKDEAISQHEIKMQQLKKKERSVKCEVVEAEFFYRFFELKKLIDKQKTYFSDLTPKEREFHLFFSHLFEKKFQHVYKRENPIFKYAQKPEKPVDKNANFISFKGDLVSEIFDYPPQEFVAMNPSQVVSIIEKKDQNFFKMAEMKSRIIEKKINEFKRQDEFLKMKGKIPGSIQPKRTVKNKSNLCSVDEQNQQKQESNFKKLPDKKIVESLVDQEEEKQVKKQEEKKKNDETADKEKMNFVLPPKYPNKKQITSKVIVKEEQEQEKKQIKNYCESQINIEGIGNTQKTIQSNQGQDFVKNKGIFETIKGNNEGGGENEKKIQKQQNFVQGKGEYFKSIQMGNEDEEKEDAQKEEDAIQEQNFVQKEEDFFRTIDKGKEKDE